MDQILTPHDDVEPAETGMAREHRLAREGALIEAARASVAAGRTVPLEDVQAWVDSLGTDHELPGPRSGR